MLRKDSSLCNNCVLPLRSLDCEWIMSTHRQCGHPGIKWMLYFARMINSVVDKVNVRMVVKRCEVCQSTDQALVQWKKYQLHTKW